MKIYVNEVFFRIYGTSTTEYFNFTHFGYFKLGPIAILLHLKYSLIEVLYKLFEPIARFGSKVMVVSEIAFEHTRKCRLERVSRYLITLVLLCGDSSRN